MVSLLSLAISVPATYLVWSTLLFMLCITGPHRACSTRVTSHHASATHMMRQDVSANQKVLRHSNRRDGWTSHWEYTIISCPVSGLYDFYENVNELKSLIE